MKVTRREDDLRSYALGEHAGEPEAEKALRKTFAFAQAQLGDALETFWRALFAPMVKK